MFLATGMQQFVIAGLVDEHKWFFVLFGALFVIAGVIALISPENTFAALADILGFLFLIVGTFWVIQAFASREGNELWAFGLIAGIWALMTSVTDFIRAFQIRKLGKMV